MIETIDDEDMTAVDAAMVTELVDTNGAVGFSVGNI